MNKPCLQCPADTKALALRRGLCLRCYRRQCLEVRRGKTTWAALERAGRVLPARPLGEGWRGFKV